MPYKVYCSSDEDEEREEPVAAVFKMKKSHREIMLARKLLEETASSLEEGGTGQALTTEEALQYAHDIVQAEALAGLEEHSSGMDKSTAAAATAAEEWVDTEKEDEKEEESQRQRHCNPPAYIVSHPWHIVDYHLYLCSAEKGMDLKARREEMYLYDGVDCRRFTYDEFAADRSLASSDAGSQPQLLFCILPIAERQHIADKNPSFGGRHYVLGFDFNCKTLYARHFEWFPHDIDDIWCVWDSGCNLYTVTVPDLISILQSSLGRGEMHVGMGILSSSPFCLALASNDDPGLEIVIATLWCQWLLDFSEILFQDGARQLPDFRERLAEYVEQGRLILQRASYRAWFAVRDGCSSKEQYKHTSTINQYVNDLYTFEKSAEDGSLKGRVWSAPGLDTCNQIREKDRMQRRRQAERRLEDLFVAPDSNESEDLESVIKKMLARTQESLILNAMAATPTPTQELPRTPSPRPQQYTPPASSDRWMSPGSPDIVTRASEQYDEFGVNEYEHHHHHHHRMPPLSVLLERALDMVQMRPELDTLANRMQFGGFLEDIGLGYNNNDDNNNDGDDDGEVDDGEVDGWKLDEASMAEIPSRCFLPSGLFD